MKPLTAPPASRSAGTRRRRTPLLAALAGLAVLIAGTIATAAPALAAGPTSTGYSYYSDHYVSAEGNFTNDASGAPVYTLTDGSFTLSCANGPSWAKVEIDVEDTAGLWQTGQWHVLNTCSPNYVETWIGLSWKESEPIKAWTMKVQREGGGIATGNVVLVS